MCKNMNSSVNVQNVSLLKKICDFADDNDWHFWNRISSKQTDPILKNSRQLPEDSGEILLGGEIF